MSALCSSLMEALYRWYMQRWNCSEYPRRKIFNFQDDSCSWSGWDRYIFQNFFVCVCTAKGTYKWLVVSVASFTVCGMVFSYLLLRIIFRCNCLLSPKRVASSWIYCILSRYLSQFFIGFDENCRFSFWRFTLMIRVIFWILYDPIDFSRCCTQHSLIVDEVVVFIIYQAEFLCPLSTFDNLMDLFSSYCV